MWRVEGRLLLNRSFDLILGDELDVSFFSALAKFVGLFLKVRMVCDGG
jgi:hypothetical protein